MAAALSYYTVFSLPGLLILLVTIAGWIWDPQDVRGAIAVLQRFDKIAVKPELDETLKQAFAEDLIGNGVFQGGFDALKKHFGG